MSQDNLGKIPGLVAGASLSIDYVLTVAVSVAAGIAALTSYFPALDAERIPLCLVALLLVMVANLRGVSSSAKLLSFPTYLFLAVVMVMLVAGAFKVFGGSLPAISPEEQTRLLAPTLEAEGGKLMAIGPVLLMRAFSSGCAALTGIEAISDSVAAFRPVEWRNARKVLTVMVLLLATMFGGISALAHHTGIVYAENGPTLLYQLGQLIFGNGVLLAVLQLATLLILLLAANTAYADFPRLAAFLAQDGFLPRQLASLGDRLVFSNGIFALSGCAALLLVIFNASVTRLIPLYAVGVFISFTLSQAGMVVHWWKGKGQGWLGKALVNGVGAAITAVVGLVLLYSKFNYGAWLVLVAIPLLIALFLRIRNHYDVVARRLRMSADKLLKLPDPPRFRWHPHGGAGGPVAPRQLRGDSLCPHCGQRPGGPPCGPGREPDPGLHRAMAAPGARCAAGGAGIPLPLPGGSGGGLRETVRARPPQGPQPLLHDRVAGLRDPAPLGKPAAQPEHDPAAPGPARTGHPGGHHGGLLPLRAPQRHPRHQARREWRIESAKERISSSRPITPVSHSGTCRWCSRRRIPLSITRPRAPMA